MEREGREESPVPGPPFPVPLFFGSASFYTLPSKRYLSTKLNGVTFLKTELINNFCHKNL
jgi:hypothetical protein